MEEDEIQAQACKLPRLGNNNNNNNGNSNSNSIAPPPGSDGSTTNRIHGWHHSSSRIIRVSRASGGKDRHSKVMTSKGLRDRRVRLSVTTAIQFYDLQDRLGYDQPSKAVEWLIKSAADAIAELPSLNTAFPDTPKQPSDEKRPGFDPAELEGEANCNHHQNNNNLSKSACSSTSETSKGSGLSLSRSDIRVKARERARERAAKDKKKDNSNSNSEAHHSVNPVSQTASFTELLTGGISSAVPNAVSPKQQQQQQWGSAPMDYFSTAFLGASSSSRAHQAASSSAGFSASQIQLGQSLAEAMSFNHQQQQQQQSSSSDQLQMQQHFSFIPDQYMPAVVTCANSHHQQQQQQSGGDNNNSNNEYNLNFTMSSSSGLAGYNNNNNNRGTLQSNSPSHLLPHHLQRFSLPMDGSTVPFFIGAAAPAMENHHQHLQFSPVFDGRLQLCYGDGSRHSDHKGKAKN